MIRTLPLLAVLIAALAASAGGCGSDDPSDPGSPGGTGGEGAGPGTGGAGGGGGEGGGGGGGGTYCEVDDDCEPDERCDENNTCVPRCTTDAECGADTGLRCDEENGGICIKGDFCRIDAHCGDRISGTGYCDQSDPTKRCVCVPDASVQQEHSDLTGVCRRVQQACTPCTSDIECADGGTCAEYNFGGETTTVCLSPTKQGSVCPRGHLPVDTTQHPELAGLCVPQFGDCKDYEPCREDDDCPQSLPVCDQRRQICIPGCTFDYDTNKSQNCPPDEVCHATVEGTDPNLLNECTTAPLWDVGSCAAPCDSNDYCEATRGEGWVCRDYDGERRCVPTETGCMNDAECEQSDPNAWETGFCDVSTFECVYDSCRLGADMRLGCTGTEPWPDCYENYKCEPDPVSGDLFHGLCVEKDCIDKGGSMSCLPADFCANAPYRDMMTGEVLDDKFTEPPAGVQAGECFPMEVHEWCVACEGNEACEGMGVTNHPDLPNLCLQVADGVTSCAPGCRYDEECPSGWQCGTVGRLACADDPNDNINMFQFCEDDTDCGGTPGSCVVPKLNGSTFNTPPTMKPWKVCKCDPAADACGDGFQCNAGIATAKDGEVLENYCAKPGNCGAGGSCEFFGDYIAEDPMNPNSPTHPMFYCGNDGGAIDGLDVACPPSHIAGQNRADRFGCYLSQVCIPWLNEDGVCGLPIGGGR